MLIELDSRSQTTATRSFLPYVFGLTAVVAATMMALMAQLVFGGVQPYVIYILPVMAAAAYGGLLPGLGATSASALAIVLVFLPHGAMNPAAGLLLLLFLLDGLCISCTGKSDAGGDRDLSACQEGNPRRPRDPTEDSQLDPMHLARSMLTGALFMQIGTSPRWQERQRRH